MLKINTVTGTCTPQELGTTLVHEHLLIAWSGWEAEQIFWQICEQMALSLKH